MALKAVVEAMLMRERRRTIVATKVMARMGIL